MKKFATLLFLLTVSFSSYAQESIRDSLKTAGKHKYIHALSFRINSGGIIQSNPFFKGENSAGKPINTNLSAHIRYNSQYKAGTWTDKVFGSPYQGIGVSYNTFFNSQELGNPIGLYIFQGARIARFTQRLSFNYEWNLGIAAGWKPYDFIHNRYNDVIGSKLNAYINVGANLTYAASKDIDIQAGVSLTHYSNGNTKTPNKGLNMVSGDIGIRYNFGRKSALYIKSATPHIAKFPKHMEHELLFFASWRRTSLDPSYNYPNPYLNNKFAVIGLSYSPMYAVGYKFRIGPSLDLYYDQSAGVTFGDHAGQIILFKPPFSKQLFAGLAAKADFVMPYFTLSASLGYNVMNNKTANKSFYQIFALKVNATKDIFINIGYRLSSFKNSNFLMLGFGFRLNNFR